MPTTCRPSTVSIFPFVWKALRRLGIPACDLSDATQDVFVVVHRKLDEFRGEAQLTTWLYAICFRVASDRRRTARSVLEVLSPMQIDVPDANNSSALLERRDAWRLLEHLMDEMPTEQRAVFSAFELDGLSCAEIAGVLEIPLGTVYSRLRLAREYFQKRLARLSARERLSHARKAGRMNDPKRWIDDDAAATGLARAVLRAELDHEPPTGAEHSTWAALAQRLGNPPDGGDGGGDGGGTTGADGGGAALGPSAGITAVGASMSAASATGAGAAAIHAAAASSGAVIASAKVATLAVVKAFAVGALAGGVSVAAFSELAEPSPTRPAPEASAAPSLQRDPPESTRGTGAGAPRAELVRAESPTPPQTDPPRRAVNAVRLRISIP